MSLEKLVCAVVVTFHPKSEYFQNLAKVRPQVHGLVVVDNGSSPQALEPFRQATKELDFELIENGENRGIGAALNIGARWAQSQGYKWVAFFDQDSSVTERFIQHMLAGFDSAPEPHRVAIVESSHLAPDTGIWHAPPLAKDGTPLAPMTSGSMIPLRIFNECGWFEDDLIIDMVDTEFAFRVRSFGYTTILAEEAILMHVCGHPTRHWFLGKVFTTYNQSPPRRYYMNRNRLILMLRYWSHYPGWCIGIGWTMLTEPIKICLAESSRWIKLKNTVRGICDAFTGKMGKVVDL